MTLTLKYVVHCLFFSLNSQDYQNPSEYFNLLDKYLTKMFYQHKIERCLKLQRNGSAYAS